MLADGVWLGDVDLATRQPGARTSHDLGRGGDGVVRGEDGGVGPLCLGNRGVGLVVSGSVRIPMMGVGWTSAEQPRTASSGPSSSAFTGAWKMRVNGPVVWAPSRCAANAAFAACTKLSVSYP